MMPTWGSWRLASVPVQSIGPRIRRLSTQSRIRDHAAAAGHFPLWELWRALTALHQVGWEATPNSNWWIAVTTVDHLAATEVGTNTESSILARPELLPRPATHTE